MPVKIRLQRFGKKLQPFYHIVVADSRAPRDGKFIEQIGIYNPRTNPATIELNNDKALDWIKKGAQPSDTCRTILSYKGVLYRKHLETGVKKGALTQEQADEKFNAWMEQKNLHISKLAQDVLSQSKDEMKNRIAEEAKIREKVAEKVAAKRIAESEAIASAAKSAVAEAAAETAPESSPEATETSEPAENSATQPGPSENL